jgi:hypothetical protein
MKSRQRPKTVQLTIRGVPSQVKNLLYDRAQAERKSLNMVLVEALNSSAGIDLAQMAYGDLDHLVGLWQDDHDFDSAMRAQDEVDETIWP